MSDRRRFPWAVGLVFLLGVAMRTLPMWRSPLPVRADGLFYAADAAATLDAGRLPLERMATDDLGFASLLAEVALVTGVDPWLVAQPTVAVVGAVPALLVVAVARRVAAGRGWAPGRARLAGLLGGTFLAVEGLYLHRSWAVDEQTAGLLVVPLAVVALHRAVRTGRPAWWATGATLLAVLPPLHNLDAMVAATALTVLVGLVVVRRPLDRSVLALAGVTAAFWLAFGGYHLLAERYTPTVIVQEARLTDVPGLFVAWLVGGLLAVAWATRARPRAHRVAAGSVFGVMFGLVALNGRRAVFPAMPETPPVVLWLVVPLALPAALAAWRTHDLWHPDGDGPAMVAQATAVLALVGVTLTAALTPVYLGTAYRTSVFLHVPVAVPVGLGTVAVMARRPFDGRQLLRVGLAGAVVVSAIASVPLAFGGLAAFNYRAVTPPGERAAAGFAGAHVPGRWTAGDHVARVASAQYPAANVTRVPTYVWLVDDRRPPACPALVQRSLTTRGTQFVTTGVVRLSRGEYHRFVAARSVVYDGGGRDRFRLVVPRNESAGC